MSKTLSFSEDARRSLERGVDQLANAVTNDVCDPISGMPEFKVCAVSIARADLFAPTDEGVLV
mgnify:CR=1 FL=1